MQRATTVVAWRVLIPSLPGQHSGRGRVGWGCREDPHFRISLHPREMHPAPGDMGSPGEALGHGVGRVSSPSPWPHFPQDTQGFVPSPVFRPPDMGDSLPEPLQPG